MCILVGVIPFFFKSGFAPCTDTRNANYRAGCREKVDNFKPTWKSSLQSEKIAQARMIGRDFYVSFDDLC